MGRIGTKKVVLLGIWLALLVGIVVWVNIGAKPAGINPNQPVPAPQLDTAKLAAQWPQILAHAAAPPRGAAGTRYTVAEFGDFQCPQCGKVRPLLEKLLARYPTQVNLIFVHRPLPNLHEWALGAGQASEIAAAEGKFWPMYDVLYGHQDDLEPGFYGDYAAKAGLNKARFQKLFDAGQGMEQVKASSQFADALGIGETPTLLLYDNVAETVTVYVGTDGTKYASGATQYAGANDLLRQPPWAK